MCDSGHPLLRGPGHGHAHAHGHGHAHPRDGGGGFRVVVAGKGGVGKTSLTALIARLLSRRGHR
ncbi:MAG: hypothetical protein MUF57_08645, partial [Gammaproteobacteria bacterium]|nr:hypothetical protein [Gammaproteobacteria bacterium]